MGRPRSEGDGEGDGEGGRDCVVDDGGDGGACEGWGGCDRRGAGDGDCVRARERESP
jgi:hypothetical protein